MDLPICDMWKNQKDKDTVARQTAQYNMEHPFERISLGSCWTISNVTRGQSAYYCGGQLLLQMVRGLFGANHRYSRDSQSSCGKFDFTHMGVPLELHTNRGRNSEENLLSEMCKQLKINTYRARTTALQPLLEFKRTLLHHLSTDADEHHKRTKNTIFRHSCRNIALPFMKFPIIHQQRWYLAMNWGYNVTWSMEDHHKSQYRSMNLSRLT